MRGTMSLKFLHTTYCQNP